jgi:hypothetical protein
MNAQPFPPNKGGSWGAVVADRPQLTAKALRALGRPVPANVDDRDVIVLVYVEETS